MRRWRRDASYSLNRDVSGADLASVIGYRAFQALRGVAVSIRMRQAGLPLFVGRNVVVRRPRKMRFGRCVILDDNVCVDANSVGGLHVGDGCSFGRGTEIRCSGVVARPGVGIEMGRNVGVAPGCYVGGQGGVSIGNDVIIGPGTVIISEDHQFGATDLPIRRQGEVRTRVVIEDNVWLGARVVVLRGVRIGAGSVVGAGAVVRESLPPRCVAVGVPARVTKWL
jgi:acetyltransferase-like isoleucine patch superfamily enzyme